MKSDVYLELGPAGQPNLLANGERPRPLYSRRAPAQASKEWLSPVWALPNEHFLLCGFGLGYGIDDRLTNWDVTQGPDQKSVGESTKNQRGPANPIHWYEPHYHAIVRGLEQLKEQSPSAQKVLERLRTLHQSGRLFTEQESALDFAARMASRCIVQPVYQRLWPELFAELTDLVRAKHSATKTAVQNHSPMGETAAQGSPSSLGVGHFEKTKDYFLQQWVRNWWRHLQGRDLQVLLQPKVKVSRPVVILAGGPNLDVYLPLREALQNAFVIAADTAMAFCRQHTIHPQVILSIDAGRGTAHHLQAAWRGTESQGEPLFVTWLGGNRQLFVPRTGALAVYATNFPLDQMLTELHPEIISIDNPSGNIIGAAMAISRKLFDGQIHIFGVAAGLPLSRSHYAGSAYDDYYLGVCDRRQPWIQLDSGYGIHRALVQNLKEQVGQTSATASSQIYIHGHALFPFDETLKQQLVENRAVIEVGPKSWSDYTLALGTVSTEEIQNYWLQSGHALWQRMQTVWPSLQRSITTQQMARWSLAT